MIVLYISKDSTKAQLNKLLQVDYLLTTIIPSENVKQGMHEHSDN